MTDLPFDDCTPDRIDKRRALASLHNASMAIEANDMDAVKRHIRQARKVLTSKHERSPPLPPA